MTQKKGVLFDTYSDQEIPKQGEILISTPRKQKKGGMSTHRSSQRATSMIDKVVNLNMNPEIQKIKKEAYKEAIREVYKEKVKSNIQPTQQEATTQATRQGIADKATAAKKFDTLIERSQHLLFSAHTVFPFDIFPKDVIIDQNKVNIIHREFFASQSVISIPIEDIKSVTVEAVPFLSTLRIVTDAFSSNQTTVRYLKTHDAYKARRIIEGLIVATKQHVDITNLEVDKEVEKIEELGAVQSSN